MFFNSVIGYVIEPLKGNKGCSLIYVSSTDPRGAIPTWAVNKGTQFFTPKVSRNYILSYCIHLLIILLQMWVDVENAAQSISGLFGVERAAWAGLQALDLPGANRSA